MLVVDKKKSKGPYLDVIALCRRNGAFQSYIAQDGQRLLHCAPHKNTCFLYIWKKCLMGGVFLCWFFFSPKMSKLTTPLCSHSFFFFCTHFWFCTCSRGLPAFRQPAFTGTDSFRTWRLPDYLLFPFRRGSRHRHWSPCWRILPYAEALERLYGMRTRFQLKRWSENVLSRATRESGCM